MKLNINLTLVPRLRTSGAIFLLLLLLLLVKALRYQSDGLGIDSRWCHWIFQ